MRGIAVVGEYPANSRGGHEYGLRPHFAHPEDHLVLARQVDGAAVYGQNLALLASEPAHQGGTHHATMPRYPDALACKRVGHPRPDLWHTLHVSQLALHVSQLAERSLRDLS